MTDIYVRDKETGRTHRVGDNKHDMITVDSDGHIRYQNLQNGMGCRSGSKFGGYEFVPNEDDHGYAFNPMEDLITNENRIDRR